MHSSETEKALTLLTERLERLERKNSWLVRIALVMGSVLLLVMTLGAVTRQPGTQETVRTQDPVVVSPGDIPGLIVTQEVVRTKNLQIVDDDGILRASFEIKEADTSDTFEGNPMLTLFDEGGNARAILSLFAGNPGLALYDDEGYARAVLRLAAGNPHLEMYDQKRLRADYECIDGNPGLALFGDHGGANLGFGRWCAPFCLWDENGQEIFAEP
jgi:hypothetical protein